MYSVVLMMAMSGPAAEIPQGIIFNRGARASSGCNGAGSPPAYNSTGPLRNVLAARRDALAERTAALEERREAVKEYRAEKKAVGAGCNGSTQLSYRSFQEPPVYSAGCSGGGVSTVRVGGSFSPYDQNPNWPWAAPGTLTVGNPATAGNQMTVGDRRLFLRLEFLHSVNVQERAGKMTALEAEAARSTMRNPAKRAQLISKIESAQPKMGASGDHPLLDWFIQAWPTILQMIKDVMAMFAYDPELGLQLLQQLLC